MPRLLEKIKGFPLKIKSFRNTATKRKLQGVGFLSPPPLYHDRVLNLRVRQRVKFHEHEWHPDCEQNVYLCSRVTGWLCMVTLFSVIFRAIAIITLQKFKSNFISKLFACFFFLGRNLKALQLINKMFQIDQGCGREGVIKQGFISCLELVLQSGRHLRESQNLSFPTIVWPRIQIQSFKSFHCRKRDSIRWA